MENFRALPGLAEILAKYEDERQRQAVRSGLGQLSGGFEPYLPNLLSQPGLGTLPFSGGQPSPSPSAGSYAPPTAPNAPYTGPTSFQPLKGGRYPVQDRTPTSVPQPSVVAPEIQRVAQEAWARWPGLENLGTHVVRNIAGTNTPSQHSYGNAIDIGGTPDELSQLATWAARRAGQLGISQVIYRDAIWTPEEDWHPYTGGGHESHVHITGPQRYSDTSPSFPEVKYNPPRRRPRTPVTTRRGLTSTGGGRQA